MLNDLVKKYKDNLNSRDELYDHVKNEKVEKAKKEVIEKKEVLRAETEMKVTEDNNEEDVKNIEALREIVNESDKLFYENLQKEADAKAAAEKANNVLRPVESIPVPEPVPASNLGFEEFGTYVSGQTPDEPKPEIVFDVPSMENLESADPWMQRKK
jgi:hypothetical protein